MSGAADTLSGRDCTAYIVQETKGAPLLLCVIDHDKTGFHTFNLSIANASRLVAECGTAVNEHLGGLNLKWPLQEIVGQLVKQK